MSEQAHTHCNKSSAVGAQENEISPSPSHLEFHKAFYDYLKHISTMSTGSILLLAAFLEKIFAQPRWKPLIAVSVAGFLVTVVASVVTYSVMVFSFPRPGIQTKKWEGNLVIFAILLTWLGFFSGVISLAIFIVKNLFA